MIKRKAEATVIVPNEEPVWKGDLAPARNGVKVLGTPPGTHEYVRERGRERQKEEQRLLDTLPSRPDLQYAWLLLYFSAVPRANHLLRAVPPSVVQSYARRHDEAVWHTPTQATQGEARGGTGAPQTKGTAALQTGRMRIEVCRKDSSGSVLGCLGGRTANTEGALLDAGRELRGRIRNGAHTTTVLERSS